MRQGETPRLELERLSDTYLQHVETASQVTLSKTYQRRQRPRLGAQALDLAYLPYAPNEVNVVGTREPHDARIRAEISECSGIQVIADADDRAKQRTGGPGIRFTAYGDGNVRKTMSKPDSILHTFLSWAVVGQREQLLDKAGRL